jgi:gas vesicle protein
VTQPKSGRRPSVTFLAGLGIGVAIGAAAALLLAPRKGSETRQALRNRGRKIGNRARDAWEDLRIELEATRRALKRKRRDAKMEIEEEQVGRSAD